MMPTAGMLWIRSTAHRGENRGKRAMQIPPTQIALLVCSVEQQHVVRGISAPCDWAFLFCCLSLTAWLKCQKVFTEPAMSNWISENLKGKLFQKGRWNGKTHRNGHRGYFWTSFGCCWSNWAFQVHGLMYLPQHHRVWGQESRLWPKATSGFSGDLCPLAVGCPRTCMPVRRWNAPTPPSNGMPWSSLTPGPCWGWLQGRAQKFRDQERSLGTGTDPSLTRVPLWLYIKLAWPSASTNKNDKEG